MGKGARKTQGTRRTGHGYWLLVLSVAVLAMLAGWFAYWAIGRTPGEILDYAEKRLEGHPGLQAILLPMSVLVRDALDQPGPAIREQWGFVVPLPPTRTGTDTFNTFSGIEESFRNVVRVGPGRSLRTIAAAATVARDGDLVEIDAGDYIGDTATWTQRKLTIRAVGGRARLIADGLGAEGKAIWVIRNGVFDVANIDFIGARVEDKNGAGIRFENGHLKVRDCLFWDSDNGILSSGGSGHQNDVLSIENSEFGYNGHGDGFSHNLYVGQIGLLSITGSYFHHAYLGHLIKSRAARSVIVYNRLTDESGGRASYELEFPNGGLAVVVGNIIQQARSTENSTMISFGAEGYVGQMRSLYLASNTLVNDQPLGGAFARVAPGADVVVAANNLLVGKGRIHTQDRLNVANNVHVDWDAFAQPVRYDYRLRGKGLDRRYAPGLPPAPDGVDLVPRLEYAHPHRLQPIEGAPKYPGALQSIADPQ